MILKMTILQEVVSASILRRASYISDQLSELKIPHVLIGGLAVGIHGYPRTTKDVDFLVGDEAFAMTEPVLVYREELKDLVRVGETDILSVPTKFPILSEELRLEEDLPVISLHGLILMKLDAFRPRDQEDVRVLLSQSPSRIREVHDHLQKNAPELLSRFAEVLEDLPML